MLSFSCYYSVIITIAYRKRCCGSNVAAVVKPSLPSGSSMPPQQAESGRQETLADPGLWPTAPTSTPHCSRLINSGAHHALLMTTHCCWPKPCNNVGGYCCGTKKHSDTGNSIGFMGYHGQCFPLLTSCSQTLVPPLPSKPPPHTQQ